MRKINDGTHARCSTFTSGDFIVSDSSECPKTSVTAPLFQFSNECQKPLDGFTSSPHAKMRTIIRGRMVATP